MYVLCVIILGVNLLLKCDAGTFANVVDLACRTNPTLTMCQGARLTKAKDEVLPVLPEETQNPEDINSETSQTPLSSVESKPTESNAPNDTKASAEDLPSSTEEPKNLSPEVAPKDLIFQATSFLKNESLDAFTESPSKSSSSDLESLKEHYCHTYITNFTNYCHGRERFKLPEVLQARLLAFCDSFKATCYPMHSTPCTPDCDQRFHPHCTVSCKCHYLYPFVLKFCSPVTIHSLEDVCRSWFIKCAKIHSIDD